MATNQNKKAEPLDWTANTENKGNPFTNGFNSQNFNQFNNFSQQMFNMNHIRELANRNIQAASQINQVILEGFHAIANRTTQIMQQNTQNSMECLKDSLNCKSLNDVQHKQSSLLNNMVENLSNNAKEVAEIASKATMEVLDVCNQRIQETKTEFNAACNNAESK